jgi:hypothetical protein
MLLPKKALPEPKLIGPLNAVLKVLDDRHKHDVLAEQVDAKVPNLTGIGKAQSSKAKRTSSTDEEWSGWK